MPTAKEIIQRLLPRGTRPKANSPEAPRWEEVPLWPPDLFAVACSLLKLSDCYTNTRYTVPSTGWFFRERCYRDVITLGLEWRMTAAPPLNVQTIWTKLWKEIAHPSSMNLGNIRDNSLCDVSFQLMAIADEASKGFGFLHPTASSSQTQGYENKEYQLADYVATEYFLYQDLKHGTNRSKLELRYLPVSLCLAVPPEEACVQPKARTPQVGCTLRSFSHNLALLPSYREVTTCWQVGTSETQQEQTPFNILTIPFPYRIPGSCFEKLSPFQLASFPMQAKRDAHFFSVKQRWLEKTTAIELSGFIERLVKEAEEEVGTVHAVVLPELALNDEYKKAIGQSLSRLPNLQLFITGVLTESSKEDSFAQNKVYGCLFRANSIAFEWEQRKHHRWCLDQSQIRRYHLGHVLDPNKEWWEMIDVRERECFFTVFRSGACLATLVCEDLARIDPVQPALRSIGPNLLIALLMDGPQKAERWSSRYATVLAEDPGTAVLTLTCLGMAKRSTTPGDKELRQVALWKHPSGQAEELTLSRGAHALVLTLSTSDIENATMDSRSDGGNTVNLFLSGIREIRHPAPPPGLTE